MLNKKEIITILITIIILAFTTSMIKTWGAFLYALISFVIIFAVNISAKKAIAYYYEAKIEIKLWQFKRFGLKPGSYLKRAFPAGIFFPIISKIIFFPFTNFIWMASLIFDVKPRIHRAAKRHGLYSFSEMTERHIGIIAAAGIVANLLFSLIGYFAGFTEFAKISIYFAFFNMLPLSNLDGNKTFFGSIILWSFLAIITLIAFVYAILLV